MRARVKTRVKNGHWVLDEATRLPEGTVVDLVVDDEGDDLDEEERVALDSAITKAWESCKTGRLQSLDEVIDHLRSGR